MNKKAADREVRRQALQVIVALAEGFAKFPEQTVRAGLDLEVMLKWLEDWTAYFHRPVIDAHGVAAFQEQLQEVQDRQLLDGSKAMLGHCEKFEQRVREKDARGEEIPYEAREWAMSLKSGFIETLPPDFLARRTAGELQELKLEPPQGSSARFLPPPTEE